MEFGVDASFESQFGQKWLLIVGILTTVVAIGFFLKYSFERNWLGPVARVCISYAAGLALVAGGEISRRKNLAAFGLYLIGGGIAALYFSTYAAFQMYHLFIPPVSLLVMALTTALACGLAVRYDAVWLAGLGLVGGFLTPQVLGFSSLNPIGILSYLSVLNAGILYVAFQKQWRILNYAGFLFTYGIFADWYGSFYSQEQFWPVILFLNVFFLVYSIVPFAFQLGDDPAEKLKGFFIITPNALISFLYSFRMIQYRFSTEWTGIVTLFYAGIFLTLAEWQRRRRRDITESYVILLGQSMMFFILTVPIVFSNHAVTIFWAAQGFSILWIGLKLDRRSIATLGQILVAISAVKYFLYDVYQIFSVVADGCYFERGYPSLLAARWTTELSVMAALGSSAWMSRRQEKQIGRGGSNLFWVLLGVFLFAVLNLEAAAACHDYFPRGKFAVISILWAIYAMSIMALGIRSAAPVLRHLALTLFSATTLKVFLIDMANVSTPFRILSCAVLGLLLIYASYLYHKHRNRLFGLTSAAGDTEDKQSK